MLNSGPPAPTNGSSNAAPTPPTSDGRSGLLAQIQAGTKLKNVGQPVEKTGLATGTVKAAGNDRDQMMEQIKLGTQLKHVSLLKQFS
jgi:hypothetical protein